MGTVSVYSSPNMQTYVPSRWYVRLDHIGPIYSSYIREYYLVRVATDCNRSYCEDSFSGYSGSVWGWYTCWGVSTPRRGLGLRMVKELDPAAGTGNEWEERNWLPACEWYIMHKWGVDGWISNWPNVENFCYALLGHFSSPSWTSYGGVCKPISAN